MLSRVKSLLSSLTEAYITMRDNGPNPAWLTIAHCTPHQVPFPSIQPISGLRSLCTNTTSCALQPLKMVPAALRTDQNHKNPGTRAMDSTTQDSVRRSLFGPVDHEQLRRDLRLRLQEMSEQDSRRWNFDFQTDTPLAGRFQWEEVPLHCAAALYQESAERGTSTTTTAACPTSTETQDRLSAGDQENCSSISNTRLRPAEETPARRKRARSRSVDKPGKCARITGEQRVPSA